MNDLRESEIFEESEEWDEEVDWELLDQQSDILFGDLDPKAKLKAINDIDIGNIEEKKAKKERDQRYYDTEKRIRQKTKEMEERGLTEPESEVEEEEPTPKPVTRYGRSPLHEAIAMKDICLVKKFVKRGLFLTDIDNNGHTPMEMAYYEGYEEAMIVFNTYKNEK